MTFRTISPDRIIGGNKIDIIQTSGAGNLFLADDGTYKATPGAVTSVNGQTGVVVLTKSDIGLGNVDNTSDADKPVSTLQAASIATKKTDSMSTNKLLGRGTAGTGVIEEITLGTNLSLSGNVLNATGGGGGSGTVTDVSVVSANGFAGSVANSTTTPAITLSTTISGLLKGNGTAILAAVAETDYVTPTGAGTLTNKTLSLGSNTITGTKAQFDTAATDGNFVFVGDNATQLNMSTARLLGRSTAGSGAVEEIILGTNLSFSGNTLNATGGGGLTNFTEAVNTSAPNATVPVVSLSATNAATNVDIAIVPKGTGAFTLAIADNTATGGNKRGGNAVDLQTFRTSNTRVASGYASVISGGTNNTASNTNSTVSGGTNNIASGQYSGVLSGDNNTASGTNSIICGGSSNLASNAYATILGGSGNTVSGNRATIGGGNTNTASNDYATVCGGNVNTASGIAATVSGNNNTAQSYGEWVGGIFATIGSGTAGSYVSTDRLFVIGNGTGTGARSNALTILKNGNTTVSGTLSASNLSGTNTGDQTAFNTGLLTGGVVTINADPTKFDVSAGTGVIYDWSNPAAPTKINVSWSAFTAQTIPDFTKPFTTVEIDSAGALVKASAFGTDNTADKRRQKIILAALFHPNGTSISSVINVVKPGYEVSEAAIDYIYQLGPLNSGNGASANGANLQINKAAGTTTLPWINYFTDPTKPTTQTNGAVTSINFNYNYRNGSGGFVISSLTNAITPDLWDDGTGVLATVPNNKFTIQRIYYFSQSNLYGVTYGQALYSSITEAQAAITSENPVINPLAGSGVFVTALIVKKGTTALNNTADASFSAISSLTSSGTGATQNLQSVYNNSTPNPEVVTNSTNGALTFRNGAGADTLSVIEVQNAASTPTFGITGLGWTGVGTNAPTGSLDVHATVYNPGTVSVSGTAVTGVGTQFTKTFKTGDSITTTTSSGSETREINSITSDTVMATVSAFAGTNSNTVYTSSNIGTQLLVLPNGNIRPFGSPGSAVSSVNDWINKSNTVNITGSEQICAFRDQTTINQTLGVTGNINTFVCLTQINATGTGSFGAVRGFNSAPTVLSTNTGNITTIAPLLSAAQIQAGATGTITNSIGVLINPLNSSTTNTVVNQYGIQIAPTQNGGTLTSYTGIAIAAKPTAATNSTLLLLNTTVIPSGTFGIYNTSTADNYLAGSLGIGAPPLAGYNLYMNKNPTGATSLAGALVSGVVQSDVTSNFSNYDGSVNLSASVFTLADYQGYNIGLSTLGGATVTRLHGFRVRPSFANATGSAYGFRGQIASATNAYNLYMDGTAANYFAGALEIGNISDTTLTRASAGILAVEGVNIPTISSTDTLTNKRITRRAPTVTQSATPTINTDVTDVAHITGLAQAITSMTTNLTGTPVEGDMLRIDITDNGTARAITWGASFEASGNISLPTTTVASTRLDCVFVWNTVTSKWRITGVA